MDRQGQEPHNGLIKARLGTGGVRLDTDGVFGVVYETFLEEVLV
jgi:hypothetical protein